MSVCFSNNIHGNIMSIESHNDALCYRARIRLCFSSYFMANINFNRFMIRGSIKLCIMGTLLKLLNFILPLYKNIVPFQMVKADQAKY